jgi:hypothetical protein
MRREVLMLQQLRARVRGFTRDLLDEMDAAIRSVGRDVRFQHADVQPGSMFVAAYSPSIAGEVGVGDFVYGGVYLLHEEKAHTEAGIRVYRVACCNGALSEVGEGQRLEFASDSPPSAWRANLRAIVSRGFEGGHLDAEAARLRHTLETMLASPYEHLLHLAAEGLITENEQARIQHAFDEAGDSSVYGLVNAVTTQAHAERSAGGWRRALEIERLGGEIARGDHQPPTGVFSRQ